MAAKVYNPEYPGLYYFDTFTFTTLGTSGHRGPDPTKGYANPPWNPDQFSIVDGQQQWTVPATGTYNIVAAGAYGAKPGRVVSGDIDLSEGQVLTMLVGQQPTPLTANVQDNLTVGGGGGTFIVSDTGTPLIVASGGDGTGGRSASFSPFGSGNGINGAGYFSNGSVTNATFQFLKPTAYINGGYGNICIKTVVPEEGGFGGGQSPVATSNVSGGGGYTGSMYGNDVTWSYTSLPGVTYSTTSSSITLDVAQGTKLSQNVIITSSGYSRSFILKAVDSPLFVLSNPGTITLNTAAAQASLLLTLTNPYGLTPTWSYPTISGIIWSTTNTSITLTAIKETNISTRSVTITTSYISENGYNNGCSYQQTFSLTVNANPGFVLSNPGTTILDTTSASVPLSLTLTNPYGVTPTWSYPSVNGVTWSTTNTGITLTAAKNTITTTQNITVTALFSVYSYSQTFSLTIITDPLFVLSNPGTTILNTTTSSLPLSLTLTNPYGVTPTWSYPTITGITWSTSSTGITLTAAKNTVVSTRDMIITASYYNYSYPQTFSFTVITDPLFVLSNPGTTVLHTPAAPAPLTVTLTNPYGVTPTWSYPTITGITWSTANTGITLTAAFNTNIPTQNTTVTASYYNYSATRTFLLSASDDPSLVLSNPGPTSLNTSLSSAQVSLSLTNPYGVTPTWSYPTISGVTWSTTNTGITLTAAQNTVVSIQDITITASYYGYTYPQSFSFEVSNIVENPLLVLSNPGTTTLNTAGAEAQLSLTLTNPYGVTPTWSYPTIAGITWSTTIYGITLTAALRSSVSTQSVLVTASYDIWSYPQTFSLTVSNNPNLTLSNPGTTTLDTSSAQGQTTLTLTNPYGVTPTWSYPITTGITWATSNTGITLTVPMSTVVTTRNIQVVASYYGYTYPQTFSFTANYFVSTLAGSAGTTGSADGVGLAAQFNYPRGIACNPTGGAGVYLYVADTNSSTIRKIVVSTRTVSTIAGSPGVTGSTNGAGSVARFNYPYGIAYSSSLSFLFVTDTDNQTIRRVQDSGSTVLFSGSPGSTGSSDGTTGARYTSPKGIAIDSSNNLYITSNFTIIRKIVYSTITTSTIAGVAGAYGSADGTGTAARFYDPEGLACDNLGNLYIADTQNHTIRKLVLATNAVTTIAGLAGSAGFADGTGSSARFYRPRGIACDSSGNVYIADSYNVRIRKLIPSTGVVTTIAGDGFYGSLNGPYLSAEFSTPTGIVFSTSNSFYVVDNSSYIVRSILL